MRREPGSDHSGSSSASTARQPLPCPDMVIPYHDTHIHGNLPIIMKLAPDAFCLGNPTRDTTRTIQIDSRAIREESGPLDLSGLAISHALNGPGVLGAEGWEPLHSESWLDHDHGGEA